MELKNDIVNFAMADDSDVHVIFAADIHRGRALHESSRPWNAWRLNCNRVKGFISNRFRGNIALFKDGKQYIEKRTGGGWASSPGIPILKLMRKTLMKLNYSIISMSSI